MNKLFALDLGNKQVKMYTKNGAKVFPSYFIDADEFGNRDLLKYEKGERSTSDYISTRDDAFTYVWGSGLRLRNKFVDDSLRFAGRYNSRQFKLLADFALVEMARSFDDAAGNTLDVTLVTGAPTDDYVAADVTAQLGKALKGMHAVNVDGVDYVVNVKTVTALPQPLGTFVDRTIDDQGYVIEESQLLDVLVGIVDCGGGTVIVDAIDDMNLQKTLHGQFEEGAYSLYEAIRNELVSLGHKINVHEIEALVRAGSEDEIYTWSPNNRATHDFTSIVMKARRKYSRRVATMIQSTYKDLAKFHSILITGGAANLLIKEEILAEIPIAEFVGDSEIANVRGFYKFALNSGLGDYE